MIFVSPAEQQSSLKALGSSALWVEDYGVDYAWFVDGDLYGIQRKEVRDLVASLRDDRLAKELHQMQELARAFLLVEGSWDWNRDGISQRVQGYDRAQYVGLVCSIQLHYGVHLLETDSLLATTDVIKRVVSWTEKAEHGSLSARSAAPRGSVRDQDVWVLEGFGVGHKTAIAILEHFGGLPLTPTCTMEELLGVKGVGKERAGKFLRRFAYVEGEG